MALALGPRVLSGDVPGPGCRGLSCPTGGLQPSPSATVALSRAVVVPGSHVPWDWGLRVGAAVVWHCSQGAMWGVGAPRCQGAGEAKGMGSSGRHNSGQHGLSVGEGRWAAQSGFAGPRPALALPHSCAMAGQDPGAALLPALHRAVGVTGLEPAPGSAVPPDPLFLARAPVGSPAWLGTGAVPPSL